MPTYSAGEASVRIKPDATAFLRDLEAKLRRMTSPDFDIRLRLDSDDADREATRFRQEQQRDAIGVPVGVDTARGAADLAAWREREERNRITVHVDVDTGAAEARLAALRAQSSGIGGGGGRGGRGGGVRWHGGRGGFLSSPVGLNTLAAGASALPAAATGVTQVAAALQQLGQVGLVLPGALAGIATSFGTMKLATSGLDEVFKAMTDAQDGTAESAAKLDAAMKGIAPQAADFARAVQDASPAAKALEQSLQGTVFDGLGDSIRDIAAVQLPLLQKGLGPVATGLNQNFKQLAVTLNSLPTQGIIERILGNTGDAQSRVTAAINPLVQGVGTLAAAGTDSLPRLADALTAVSTRFQNFITAADQDGRLQTWIDESLDGVTNLGNTALNLGKSFTALTRAVGGGGGLLQLLADSTDRMATFLNSAEGQDTLRRFFAEGKEDLAQWLPILQNLGTLGVDVVKGFQRWGDVMMPVLQATTDLLTDMPGGIDAVVTAFLAWRTISGVIALGSALTGISSSLTALPGRVGVASAALGRLSSARGVGGLALMTGGAAVSATADSGLEQALGVLTSAGGGALAGSVFGPWGTAIGALGGTAAGVFGVINQHINDAEDATASAAEATRQYDAQLAAVSETMDRVRDAQKGVNDALLASGGAVDAGALGALQQQVATLPDLLTASSSPDDQKAGRAAAEAIENLGLDNAQLAKTLGGDQPLFDAMIANLEAMGPAGAKGAQALTGLRDTFLDAQGVAASTNETLAALAEKMGGTIPDAAADIRTAFATVPRDVPINVDMPQGQAIIDLLREMNVEVTVDNDKTIKTTAPLAQSVIDTLREITGLVINNNDKTISVALDPVAYQDAISKLGTLGDMLRNLPTRPNAALPPVPATPNTTDSDPWSFPPAPPKRDGGPTPSGVGPGPTGGFLAEVHSDEWILPKHARKAIGDSRLWALTRGSFRTGGYIDEHGNPVTPGPLPGPVATPGGPDTLTGGGFGSIATGFLSALGIGGPLADLAGGPPRTDVPAGDSAGTGINLIPGVLGLMQAGTDPDLLAQWGSQTGDWLGTFAAKTLSSFGSTLYKGVLGAFGLENSILSPDNALFGAAAKSAGFALGGDGPLAALLGVGGDNTSAKAPTAKKIREAQQKIADADAKVAEEQADFAALKADATEAQRLRAQNALTKAQREAEDARADYAELAASGGARNRYSTSPAATAPPTGSGAEGWRPVVMQALAEVGPRYGITNMQAWADDIIGQINFESKGNANALNPNDSDGMPAHGLGQFKAGTFAAHNIKGGSIDDGVAQVYAMIDYLASNRYGVIPGGGVDWNGVGWRNGKGYRVGGPTPSAAGPLPDGGYPAILHRREFVVSERGRATVPDSFLHALNDGQLRAFFNGGDFATAAVVPRPPRPRFDVPDVDKLQPRAPQAPPVRRPPVAVQSPAPPPPAATPPPPPAPPPVAVQPPQASPTFSPEPGNTGGGVAPAGPTDYTLPWVNQAIESTAAVGANIASSAIGSAGGGMPGAGALGQFVGGAIMQGGKVVQGIANVISATMVGSVPGSFMTTPEAYGRTLRPDQNTPQTAMSGYGQGRTANYYVEGVDTRNMLGELQLRENIEQQSALAAHPGRL